MNVRQLREELAKLPDHMIVVTPHEYGTDVEILSVEVAEHAELGAVAVLDY